MDIYNTRDVPAAEQVIIKMMQGCEVCGGNFWQFSENLSLNRGQFGELKNRYLTNQQKYCNSHYQL